MSYVANFLGYFIFCSKVKIYRLNVQTADKTALPDKGSAVVRFKP
ncbi:hypothetical protein NEILACOT_04041 [Neisseria lactamica ATCC 23970]|uniref:Uncharacterized protein n=1 Tax=Neisseria lactamica ATCC 23970 TaxID=546265 RepID=D0W936_NEILA|nr:hypothetical protein NEILACOT_04041 [Neisseria lactamica ATCC 23970]